MPSIQDWATKAAERVDDEYPHARRQQRPSVDRIAAIIATFAEPLMHALQDSKRRHYHCEDSWYCCAQCNSRDHGLEEGEVVGARNRHHSDKCTCGADTWNARVDAVLSGEKK